jgi:hypothetical protein
MYKAACRFSNNHPLIIWLVAVMITVAVYAQVLS